MIEDDDSIPSYKEKDPGVPLWLILVYILAPLWGILAFYLYWNGNYGDWLDRGYWGELQQAANTTFPAKELPKK